MKPATRTVDELQDAIVGDFLSIGDPLSQYEYLLEFAGALPRLGPAAKTDDRLVAGCQSRVWLAMEAKGGRLAIEADSDTLIVRGVLYLLIEVLGGQRLEDVSSADIYFLEKAEVMSTFGDDRRRGIGSTVAAIQRFARQSVRPRDSR